MTAPATKTSGAGEDGDGSHPADPARRARSTRTVRTSKSPRRRARELAMQGVYQWLIARAERGAIEAQLREMDGFDKADRAHFDALLHGCLAEADALDKRLAPHLDRPLAQVSPVEHAVLLIGSYELAHCLDVPYRVAINEAVELAKTFGGTDGHRFVNGVLDQAAAVLRPAEAKAR